jgi:anti-anti-sigma factor
VLELNFREQDPAPGVKVLELKGRIAAEGLEALEKELDPFGRGNPAKLIVDLEKAEGIDSQGVGILIKARFDIVNNGGKLVLLNPNDRIRTILRISGLDEYFLIATSEEQALKMLG